MKNKTTALLLSIFLGGLGIDRFYLEHTGLGILKLLTGGCFGILWLIDIILIATGELKPADGSEYEGVNPKETNEEQIKQEQTETDKIEENEIKQLETKKSTIEKNTINDKYDDFEKLEKIAKLREQGILNDEEYNKIKENILEKIG